MITVVIAAAAFAVFSYAGVLVGRTYFSGEALADGPPRGNPPVTILVAGAALAGLICALRGLSPEALGIVALSCSLMSAIWYVDVTRGIVPDPLTLIPLGILVVAGLFTGRWFIAVVALIVAAPFALMAWRTNGIGMGWGDVKLAALGGALLGVKDAMLSFALASVVAIVIAKIRRTEKQPVAFAPYLASAIVVPLCFQTGLS